MNCGKACAIFEQLESDKYSENEKLTAIKEVLDMPTHNGITKDKILGAFRWLFKRAVEDVEPEKAEEQPRWIPVTERMPEEHDSFCARRKGTDKWKNYMFEKISNTVIVTIRRDSGAYRVTTAHTVDGIWKADVISSSNEIIAWMPLPEPWRGE